MVYASILYVVQEIRYFN